MRQLGTGPPVSEQPIGRSADSVPCEPFAAYV